MAENQANPVGKSGESAKSRRRSIVYVDGFINLYHGSVKGTKHKWLNLEKYFEKLRNADDLVKVHYFTALMHGPPRTRQDAYLCALDTLPKVNVILGKYKTKSVSCNVTTCVHSGDRRFATWEEKRTDVNIAVQMIDDAYQDECDNFIIVSGDSDLVPVLHQIKLRFPDKKVIVYVPARSSIRGAAVEIRAAADKDSTLPMQLLSHCQFPSKVPDGLGRTIEKPASW